MIEHNAASTCRKQLSFLYRCHDVDVTVNVNVIVVLNANVLRLDEDRRQR